MKETRTINVLIYLSIFVSSITFFKEPFEGYFHYMIFLILLPRFIGSYSFPKQLVAILVVPLFIGVLEVLIGNNTWALFLKIFIGLFLSATFYYYVMEYYAFDTKKMFGYYLKAAVIVSYIGVFQLISYRLHFRPGYDYHWILNKWGIVNGGFGMRVNSIFSEAAQFAIVLSPACFVAIHNLIPGTNAYGLSRFQSFLILLAMILTSSSTGYVGLFIMLILFVINFGQFIYFVLGVVIAIVGANVLYNNVDEFRSRVDSSLGLWISDELSLENVNSSSFVLYNNYHIATENFKSNFLGGTGLGSHAIAYEKYSYTNQPGFLDFSFNKADANSMLLRLLSETGLIGVIFILVFIRRNFVSRNAYDNENPDWIISNAVLVLILLYLLRQGNYFLNGLPFFMWLYYTVRKQKEVETQNRLMGIEEEEEEEVEEENGLQPGRFIRRPR
ncbi:MAG: O-antigen ligase family protein [Bacteroidia bacterium]